MDKLIILMGPTGAGKSVQAERLATSRKWVHISSGSLLRRDPQTAAILARGDLAPSDATEQVVKNAIIAVQGGRVIVLDGFPRTLHEHSWLAHELDGWNRYIFRVIHIEIDEPTSTQRLVRRARGDDTPAARREKWLEYETETRPVIDAYRREGSLVVVDGRGTIDEVAIRIEQALR